MYTVKIITSPEGEIQQIEHSFSHEDSLLYTQEYENLLRIANKPLFALKENESQDTLTCPKHGICMMRSKINKNQYYCSAKDPTGHNGYCDYVVNS